MKVVMAARNTLPFHRFCGTGRYVHGLAKHLVELGVSVEVVAPPEKLRRPENDSADGIRYHFIPPQVKGSRFFGFHRSYHLHNIRAASLISKKEFDLLHIFEINAFEYLLRRKRKPVVVSPFHRGTEPWKEKNLSARIHDLPIDLPLGYCIKNCDAIASEGAFQTKRIVAKYGVPKEKIFELPDGVDLDLIGEYMRNLEFSREDIGFSEDDFVIISVGRIDPMKGVHYLIKSFAKILEEIPNAKLILVGEGSDEERIKSMIREQKIGNSVLHIKNICDRKLFTYYALSDVFVTPTLYEGLPQVVLEAMAVGLPVIATKTGENPQIVEEGTSGFLVQPGQPEELAEATIRLYDTNKRKRIGRISKKKIEGYDWKIIAKKALKEYERLTT